MSVFTDEQLAQLKDDLANPEASLFFTEDTARQLIARLEAAERMIEGQSGHDEDCDEVNEGIQCSCDYDKLRKVWFDASGKSSPKEGDA